MNAPFVSPQLRFIEPLGRGGTADVAKACAEHLRRTVAVKYPRPAAEQQPIDFAALAQREWDLIGGARFPGLVRLWEPPSTDPDYLLLELCSGPTLDSLPAGTDLTRILTILSALAVSLEYLNAAGIVHGDTKPHNVFLPAQWDQRSPESLFYAKLSDFSLGRRIEEPDSARAGLGTVGYMAPETISDSITSHSSDLFGLGVIAYQLLTGRHPFLHDESDPMRVNSAVQEAEYTPLKQVRSDLPSALVLLVMNLMALDPGARPKSAWEVCEELESIGCRYPFRKALRPSHLWRSDFGFTAAGTASLHLSGRQATRLSTITGGDSRVLRVITTSNFLHDRLVYRNRRFQFTKEIYWPHCARTRALQYWTELPLVDKKRSIRRSLAQLAAPVTDSVADPSPAYDLLLPSLLRTATVKRVARQLALPLRFEKNYEQAAGLFVLAGDLLSAEQCADQASHALQKDNHNARALRVLNMVIDFARMGSREFDIRHLLLTKGEIQKQNGDIDDAMGTYQRLVALYSDQAQDKILAEAYKDIGDLYKMKQDAASGLRELRKAHDIFAALGDNLELSHTQNNIGNLLTMSGDIEGARREYRQALAIQRRIEATGDVASSLNNLAATYCMRDRYDRGARLFQIVLDIQTELGNQIEMARSLNNLGLTNIYNNQPARAIPLLERSLKINRGLGSKYETLHNLYNLTNAMIRIGRLRECLGFLREGLAMLETQDSSLYRAGFHYSTGRVHKQMGRIAEAKRSFEETTRLIKIQDDTQLALLTDLQLTSIKYLIGYHELALTEAREIANKGRDTNDQHVELEALLLWSRIKPDQIAKERAEVITIKQRLGRDGSLLMVNRIEAFLDLEDSISAAAEAEALRHYNPTEDVDIETARTAGVLAEVALNNGDTKQAQGYLAVAERSARTSGQAFEMVRVATLAARDAFERGAYEECYARLKDGITTARKIGDNLPTDEDRRHFQQLRLIKYLGSRIRDMKERLGNRETPGR
jgi:serine/threonine protein kinase